TKGSLANCYQKPGDWKLGKLCLRTAVVEAPCQATPPSGHAPSQRNPRGTDNAQPGEQREGHLGRRRKERHASWLLRIQALESRATMENSEPDPADDSNMDAFLEKFQSQPYRGGFREDQWEEEFDKIPLFMKKAPSEIDPKEFPDLACLQSIIFDDERSPEDQAKTYKDEGNDYFKEKDYKKAVVSYSEGLKKKCNFRSALNDVLAARKLKPSHLKAIVRGAMCHLELNHFTEAVNWCDEGLQIDAKEKKLLEVRAKADKLKRMKERDLRKARLKEKKEQSQNEALLQAIKARNIRLVSEAVGKDEDSSSDGPTEIFLDGLSSENPCGARLSLDDQGRLSWPVLFLYPEYAQSDFISAFHEDSRFIDHLMAMFSESPCWDSEQKYHPDNLEVYFEDEERAELYQVSPGSTLLQVLQHPRYSVKALTPAFLICVGSSSFRKNYLHGKRVHR
ncbi:hypothetical protein U0070_018290, partial [Myodes glareolus]